MTEFFEWRDAPPGDFAVIGDPVSHSLSPKMHAAAYAQLGLPCVYRAVRVPKGEVGEALDGLRERGYRGVNVTVPHKQEALGWCDRMLRSAEEAGGANTLDLIQKIGLSTDGQGFMIGMGSLVTDRWDRPVLLLGAGGSARAVAQALSLWGWQVRLWNRTRSKVEALADDMEGAGLVLDEPDPTDCALVINATSSSLAGAALPIDWSRAPEDALAVDLMYTDGLTPFLQAAADCGLPTADGRRMLAGQGALAFEFWLGPRPFETMLEAIS
ncbi:shikimate dehydrogenase [soil metagenome]